MKSRAARCRAPTRAAPAGPGSLPPVATPASASTAIRAAQARPLRAGSRRAHELAPAVDRAGRMRLDRLRRRKPAVDVRRASRRPGRSAAPSRLRQRLQHDRVRSPARAPCAARLDRQPAPLGRPLLRSSAPCGWAHAESLSGSPAPAHRRPGLVTSARPLAAEQQLRW